MEAFINAQSITGNRLDWRLVAGNCHVTQEGAR